MTGEERGTKYVPGREFQVLEALWLGWGSYFQTSNDSNSGIQARFSGSDRAQ